MGLILDLAVAGLATVVLGSLAVLAWTLGVSATRATRQGRERVAEARRSIADAEPGIRSGAALASSRLQRAADRMKAVRRDTHSDQVGTQPTHDQL